MTKYIHPHYVSCLFKAWQRFFWRIINLVSAKYWGIEIGDNSIFYGKTSFYLLPHTNITFGNHCCFYSSHNSNRIGIYSPCMFSTLATHASISIGDNCGFSGTIICSATEVRLGNNVRCGANSMITDTDFHTDDPRTGNDSPVIIENGVWLGYGVKVLKGVHIGENSIIGACSIVTKDIPANVMAAGNPCKVIKSL